MISHLALIMDGNRRWARQRSLRPWLGHDAGAHVIQDVIKFCLQKKITHLSLYAFSLENFTRSPEEITFLFELLVNHAEEQMPFLKEKNIGVRFIGDRKMFPAQVARSIDYLEQQTKEGKELLVHFLFCYGAKQEVTAAVQTIAEQVNQGMLAIKDITPDTISNALWTSGIPDPDLIVRTGGRSRLSNFLLYQAAYSELYFLDCLWPDLRLHHLQNVFDRFTHEQRNFGS